MLIHLLKFFHLLLALGLLSTTLYCFILIGSKNINIPRLNKHMLIVALLTMITGTFLVYPKYFTFHTPWIQAAYIFLIGYCLGIFFLMKYHKKNIVFGRIIYLILLLILIFVVHDAVTKTTFLI